MFKTRGFSLAEILVALMVIGVITASAMPLMTKMAQNKTGVDRNTIICISESPAEWYKEIDGTTELPAEGTKCWAAVTDTQYNRGRALKTATWYANNGADSLKTTAKKLLRTACDRGGKEACDYFIYSCWKSGKDISPYCDDEENFLDLTYYLHQYTDITLGGIYVRDRLEKLLTKNITNLVKEVDYACFNDQKPDHDPGLQNLGNNIACELLDFNITWWIQQCNEGNAAACKYSYDKQYNRSCHEVKSVWSEADSRDYKLTSKGDPTQPGNTPVDVYCNMTNLASAAISGCNSLVPGDCEAGYINGYNHGCVQVKTEWEGVETGNFYLTYRGADDLKEVYCNMTNKASAAITGCGYNTAAEGDIPADEYVPGDCGYGRLWHYNRNCNEIFSVWGAAPEMDYYNLTEAGDSPPSLASSRCQPYIDPPDPINTCFNPQGATTDFLYTETGVDYSFRVTNCNMADHSHIVESDLYPCAGGACGDNEPGCWYGKADYCTGTGCGNDLGGGKTDKYLCNYPGAIAACHELNYPDPAQYGEGCSDGKCTKNSTGWRLPTEGELVIFITKFEDLGLCDFYSPPKCHQYPGCKGSTDNKCNPQAVRALELPNQSLYYGSIHYVLNGPYYDGTQYAFSVRCVRSLL